MVVPLWPVRRYRARASHCLLTIRNGITASKASIICRKAVTLIFAHVQLVLKLDFLAKDQKREKVMTAHHTKSLGHSDPPRL